MRILVYGAGNIGSLYAALLMESGQDVSILARGARLVELRERGIRVEDITCGKRWSAQVKVVEGIDLSDSYDLVIVALPKHSIAEVLPMLRERCDAPTVLFLGNNAAGPSALSEALGRKRVLLGFPGAAAVTPDRTLRYLILAEREQPTTIGTLDGTSSKPVEVVASVLRQAGFPVSVCANMDAWLKTHAAEISPTANALYMAGGDVGRLARTRGALVLMLRAIKEGYRVLSALGVPITPRSHTVFRWLPESLLVVVSRRMLRNPMAEIKIGHALKARREMGVLADDFRKLASDSGVATPSIDTLRRHLDPQAIHMRELSRGHRAEG